MCELLVGLPDVTVVGVGDWPGWLRIVITTRAPAAVVSGLWRRWRARHGVDEVELVDLPCFGRRTRLVWRKQRWRCPNPTCRVVTDRRDPMIASPRPRWR